MTCYTFLKIEPFITIPWKITVKRQYLETCYAKITYRTSTEVTWVPISSGCDVVKKFRSIERSYIDRDKIIGRNSTLIVDVFLVSQKKQIKTLEVTIAAQKGLQQSCYVLFVRRLTSLETRWEDLLMVKAATLFKKKEARSLSSFEFFWKKIIRNNCWIFRSLFSASATNFSTVSQKLCLYQTAFTYWQRKEGSCE